MKPEQCICCPRKTVSVIETPEGFVCYLCYTNKKDSAEAAAHKQKRKCNHEEDDIQAEFFRLVPQFFPKLPDKLLFAVPNGGKREQKTVRTKSGQAKTFSPEAARLKRQGVKKGVSDTILLIPKKGYANLCMEFKTDDGVQSEDQKDFQRQVEMANGKYVVVRSSGDAINTMKWYLE